jgi:hypothetical protein
MTFIINNNASVNNTFLAPYVGYTATIIKKNCLLIDNGEIIENINGNFCAENGWQYKIKDLLTELKGGK